MPAFPKMVEALKEAGFANEGDVILSTLNLTVRSRSIRVGDVCTYQLDGPGVGLAEVFFHSSVNGVCLTCLSDWPIVSKFGALLAPPLLVRRLAVGPALDWSIWSF